MKLLTSFAYKTLTALMIVLLALTAMPVSSAFAAIAAGQAWSEVYRGTTFPGALTYTVNAGSNRMLVVGVASSTTANVTQTVSVSYGGQALTAVVGDGATSARQHTYLFYLKDTAAVMNGAAQSLAVTITGGTSYYNYVYAAVYTGVDQSANPITNSRNYTSGAGTTGTIAFATALTINAGDQAVEMVNLMSSSSTTVRTINAFAANWAQAFPPTGYGAAAANSANAYAVTRTQPAANTTDTSSHGLSSANTWASMSGMSIKAIALTASTTTITNAAALGTATVVGQPYAVNVSVTGTGVTPTGAVTVSDGAATCTIATLAAGSGTCNLTSTSAGAKTITATYGGDGVYAGSVSAGVAHTVNKADTLTTITNAAALGTASVVGQAYAVTFSVAAVAPGAGTPTGNVTVTDGVAICTATAAVGTCNLTSTSVGAKTITATYTPGDANFNASLASTGVAHTVNKANTTATMQSDTPDPTNVGVAYTVGATVAANAPGSGTPSGTITVSDGTDTCTITLPATTCSLTSTTAGTKNLIATYNGDNNFNASPASATRTHTVDTTYTITLITGTGGTIQSPVPTVVSVSVAMTSGTSRTFDIVPNTGYAVSDVLVDGVSIGKANVHTFTNVTQNHTLSAIFDGGPIGSPLRWYQPSTVANSGLWTTPANAYTSDNNRATSLAVGPGNPNYTNFNIPAIPAGSTIDGIEVALEGYTTASYLHIFLSPDNGTTVSNFVDANFAPGSPEFTKMLGGPTDFWGLASWTPNSFTNANFVMRFAPDNFAGVSVDQAQVRVHYRQPTTLTVNAATGVYDGTVNLTGTLHTTVGNNPVSDGQIVTFYLNGVSVGTAPTVGGVATLSNVSLAGINAGTYTGVFNTSGVTASYAGTTPGALPGYLPNNAVIPPASLPAVNTLTVTKAPLIVTANDKSREFGLANPALDATITGFVNGQNLATSGVTGSPVCTTTAVLASPVSGSPYPITCVVGTLASTNYSFNFAPGALTITRATLDITASSDTMVYGGTVPTITPIYSGLRAGNTAPATVPTCTTTATSTSPVGTYPSSCTGAADPNYTIGTYTPGTVTVTKAVLTVDANDKSRSYGAADPVFDATITGFVNGDTLLTSVSGSPSCTSTAVVTSSVSGSPYTITCTVGTLTSADYSFIFTTGNLDITAVDLTITASSDTMVYGGTVPTITPIYSGLQAGDTAPAVVPTCSTTATNTSPVGSYPSTCSVVVDTNYNITYVPGTVTVTQASLLITASSGTMVYGGTVPTITPIYTGLKAGDTAPTTAPSCSTTATNTSSVGSYPSTCIGAVDANYLISYAPGNVSVTAAVLTVTANNDGKVYDNVPYSGGAGVVYSGFIAGDDENNALGGTLAYSGASQGAVNQGTYAIIPGGLTANNGNYTFSYVNGTLTITKSALLVTANNDTKTYDGIAYSGGNGVTYTGFAAGDNSTNALGGTLAYGGSSQGAINQGSYIITPSGLTANNGNYTISYADGTLTIGLHILTITANNETKSYDGIAYTGGNGVTYAGFVAGDDENNALGGTLAYTGTSQGAVDQGAYVITPGGLTATNYTIAFKDGALNINPLVLTVTAVNDAKAYDGIAYTGGNGVTYSGFAVGDNAGNALNISGLAYTGSSQGAVDQGSYNITPGGLTANNGNYTFSYQNGTLVISPIALTVTANNDSKVYDGNAYAGGNGVVYSGFAAGDNAGNALGGLLTYSGTSQGAVNQGSYSIIPSGLTANNGNYTIGYVNGALTITPAALTITAINDAKTYDGIAYTGGNGVAYSGFVPGDNAGNALGGTLSYTGTSQGAVNQGAYVITPAGLTANNGNYTISFANGTLTIGLNILTVTAKDDTKSYDGIAYSGGNGVTYIGFAPGDNAGNSLGGTLVYTGSSQGAVNQGTYVITPSGLTSVNYTIVYIDGALDITPLTLTVTAVDDTKAYDSIAYTGGNGVTYAGFASGDNAGNALGGVLSYAGSSQGAVDQGSYIIRPTGLTANNGNYTFSYQNGTLLITPIALTVTANDANKVYDKIPYSGGNGVTYTGFAVGDNAGNSLGGTLAYTGTSQGAVNQGGYVITPGGLTANNGNYTINFANGALTIGKRPITVTAGTDTKDYDSTTSSSVIPTITLGTLAVGDTANFIQTFDTANAGTGKTLTPSGVVSDGNGGNNYIVTPVDNATGIINGIPLTISGVTANGRIYDGTTVATLNTGTAALVGVISGDIVTLDKTGAAGAFANKNVGPFKAVTVTGFTIVGADSGNYILAQPTGLTATISVRPITVTAQTNTKVYDSTTSSAAVPSIPAGSLVGTDTASFTETYDTQNVGTNKVLTPSGAVTDGNLGANYSVTLVNNGTGVITARPLTITAAPKVKALGALDPLLTYSVTSGSLVGSDSLSGALTRVSGEGAGSYAILQGSVSAGPNYNLTYVGANLVIGVGVQAITVVTDAPANAAYNTNFNVTATATSGLPVTITTTGGACSGGGVNGIATITMLNGTGVCTVHFNQAGNANFTAATEIVQTTAALKADQTINVNTTAPANATYNTGFNVSATATSGLAVTYNAVGVCTNTGTNFTMTSGTGSCTVQYTQLGNANYNAAPQVTNTVNAQKANQTINVTTSAPANAAFGSNFTVAANATSGLAVTYSSSGSCTNVLAVYTMTLPTGTCTVQYNQTGNANYNAATLMTQTVNAQKANQTITVTTSVPATAANGAVFPVAATASSGQPVAITTSGFCTGSGTGSANITMTSGTGTCTVLYNQIGNANYNSAPQVTESTNSLKANQVITVTVSAPAAAINGAVFNVAATSNSGLIVAITTSGVCTGSGTGLIPITMTSSAGICTVQFNQAGDTNYNAAPQVTSTTNAQKTDQTITITTAAPATSVNGSNFTVAATASSGLTVTYSATGTCTNVGATFTMTAGTGTCTVHYNQAGNADYNLAPERTTGVTAQKANQVITVTTNAPNSAADGTSFNVVATANSGLPVAITATGVCTGSGTGSASITVTASSGTCTVHYNQPGDADYNLAPEVTKNVTAMPVGQTITVTTSAPATATNGATFTVAASASSGLPVAITTSGDCSGSGSDSAVITITSSSGTCTVHYNQPGNASNAAAPAVIESTTIDSSVPTVSINQAGAPQIDPTNVSPINFTVVFSESVTSFTGADITITGTAGATTAVVTEIAPNDGTTYNVAITGMTTDGTVIVSIPAGAAKDIAGNDSAASTSADDTVTYFDKKGPAVLTINTTPNTADNVLSEAEKVTVKLTQFKVKFNQDVYNPVGDSDPEDVTNPNNYMLIRDLGDTAGFQTKSCSLGADSKDTSFAIGTVTYDSATTTATFTVNGGLSISNGTYQLFICGSTSIVDPLDNTLKLVGSSGPGSDFIRNFTINVSGGGGGGTGNSGNGNSGSTTRVLPSAAVIPVTGFAPDHVTLLPIQPADKAYKPLDKIRIEIPTLGVDFPIVGVSLSGNNWDLTWLKENVGYLEGSAYPTFNGNTVLTAHVIDSNNNLGPFSDIKGMHINDKIFIHAYGKTYVYEVQENQKILPSNISVVFKHEEYSWVTLVTCEDYDAKAKVYKYRRMVRAVLVSVVEE